MTQEYEFPGLNRLFAKIDALIEQREKLLVAAKFAKMCLELEAPDQIAAIQMLEDAFAFVEKPSETERHD